MCSIRAIRDFFGRDAVRRKPQAFGPAPEHRALTGGLIDDDVGRLVGAILANLHVVEIDAGFAQAGELNAPALVVAHGADVFDAQPEVRSGRQCARHLAAGAQDFVIDRHLAGVSGKVRNQDKRVGGIESDADQIEISLKSRFPSRAGRRA